MADPEKSGMCEGMNNVSPLASLVLSGNFPIIVKTVLSYLPYKGLNTATRVCKLWEKLAKEVKNERLSLSWFMSILDEEETGTECLASSLKLYLESLWCQPSIFLLFMTTNLYEEQLVLPSKNSPRAEFSRAAKCGRAKIQDFISEKIPKTCKLLGVAADGAVGTSSGSPKSIECEGQTAITLLSLPKIEGIDVYSFTMDIYSSETRWHTSIDELQSPDVDIKSISGIPEDKPVKAVLFFCDEPFCPPEVGYSIMRQYEDAIVAGGYVDSLVLPSDKFPPDSDPTILCVAFCGEKLKVASVLIRENVRSPKEAEKQIMKLKDSQFPEDKSFAFMFACVGRGEGLYGNQNVESDAFRKIFPKTPLFGFFGNGEIGYNCLNLPSNDPKGRSSSASHSGGASSKRILPKLYHAYTTVICLFSIL